MEFCKRKNIQEDLGHSLQIMQFVCGSYALCLLNLAMYISSLAPSANNYNIHEIHNNRLHEIHSFSLVLLQTIINSFIHCVAPSQHLLKGTPSPTVSRKNSFLMLLNNHKARVGRWVQKGHFRCDVIMPLMQLRVSKPSPYRRIFCIRHFSLPSSSSSSFTLSSLIHSAVIFRILTSQQPVA